MREILRNQIEEEVKILEKKRETEKIERIIFDIIIFIFLPIIIGVLFYLLLPFGLETPIETAGLSVALAISIAGLLLTIRGLSREGAFFINGGIIGFLIQYVCALSKIIVDIKIIWFLWFLVILFASIPLLINVHWLGLRKKISQDLYTKFSKACSITLVVDLLIIIVYSSYSWWFGNIFSSLGLGMIIIGVILPMFKYLIYSKKLIYIFIMLPMNVGFSLMIFGGLYVAFLDLYLSFFLSCMIGFFINLTINSIFSKIVNIYSDTFWNRLFFADFLCISIFGSLFFISLLYLEEIIRIMIALMWSTSFSFTTVYFAHKGKLIHAELKEKLWIILGFGITFEISFLIALSIFYVTYLPIAIGTFSASCGILMLFFNFFLNKKYLFFINSVNISCGFGVITVISLYITILDLFNTILWGVFIINCILVGILLFGLLRKFLVKLVYYKMNFLNWICLSIVVGILVGRNPNIPGDPLLHFFLGLLIGTLIFPISLIWAETGGIIGKDWCNRFYRLIGIFINLQVATISSLFVLQYYDGWIVYIATSLIIFSFLTYFLFINVEKEPLIILNHSLFSLGIFLITFWLAFMEDPILNLVFSTWIGLLVFIFILPVCFGLEIASKKILYRFTFIIYLIFTFISTWLLNYILIPIEHVVSIYILIIFITLMLFLALHFGREGELYSEQVFYGLSSINLSFFIINLSLFNVNLLIIDLFYRITLMLLFLFILLIPDIYFLFKAKFVKERYYQRVIEVINHILSGIFAIILAGFPIITSENWNLGVGIFFTVYGILSGFIHLYYKRNVPFMIHFGIFFYSFFWLLCNVLLFLVVTVVATIFWALFIDLILFLFILDFFKYYKLIPTYPARLGIVYSSLSLSFVTSFLVEWYLLEFPPLAIISSVLLFLILSRIVILYIDENKLFKESGCRYLLQFSLWSCIIACSGFIYILLNTIILASFTLGFQIFNIIFTSFIFLGLSCMFSKDFRNMIIKGIIAFRDAFIKLVINKIFLTALSTTIGCITAVLIYIFYNNLFLGLNLAILIILICWKAIFNKKSFANYFIIGVPIILGVLYYQFLFNYVNLYLNPYYYDNLFIILYSTVICVLAFFLFTYTLWKFKSNLKFGFLIVSMVLFFILLIYNFYSGFLAFTEYFLILLPWLISGVLINCLWFSYYFKKQALIFYSLALGGLFFLFAQISFYAFFPTLQLGFRLFISISTSAGISFFIFAISARYFNVLTQKVIAIILGAAVLSSSITVGSILSLYQGIDYLIAIGLAIDFGIFLYYLSLICYFWELSKKIWEKGWFIWILVPIVNGFLVFLSIIPLGVEFAIFGIFLALSIFHILILPVIFYKARSFFRLFWFIIWGLVIPLSYSAAYFIWFKEIFASTIFTISLITVLLAILIWFIKVWKISTILWFGLSIGNGLLFFVTGFMVIELIALIGISLLIIGLQASLLTIFPNVPKKFGRYFWIPVIGGITVLTVYFALISHFGGLVTFFFAALIFLLSLYPLILFDIDKKQIYRIIGFGSIPLIPLFTGSLLWNTLLMIEEFPRAWISTSIALITTGFLLLALHRFQILPWDWIISWGFLSATIALLFSWFLIYVFQIINNIVTLTLTFLIFEIILIPASRKFWKFLGHAIVITITVFLGIVVNIYFGIALCLIFSAIFIEFQKPITYKLKIIQELVLAIGLLFLLFWGLQIFIDVLYAFLISSYVIFFYPFTRCIMKKRWLSSTLFWIGLIMVPVALGAWLALNFYLGAELLQNTLLSLCTFFSLGLVLPFFHKISKRLIAILWIALGGLLSIYLYTPLITFLIEPLPTVFILIILFTSFFIALPLFDFPKDLYFIIISALGIETSLLIINFIYIGTSKDLFLTSIYTLLIESIILIGISFWRKKWKISMLIWYLTAISIGLLYGYYTFLIIGSLTWIEYMIGLLIIGLLITLPVISSKFSINERFCSYLIFTIAITISITYFSSFIFVGEVFYIYIISLACFLFAGLLLLFYQLAANLIQEQSFLDRFYRSVFWILLSIFNISTSILVFWCLIIGISSIGFSFSIELSLFCSITLGFSLFLISGKFRVRMERYLPYLFMILPISLAGIVYTGLYFINASLNFFLILYFSIISAFLIYWILYYTKAINWRIHEYLWAVSPIPLVIYVGNLINLHLQDMALAISSGFLIYTALLLFLFIYTFENKRYLDYFWIVLTVSFTLTSFFGISQIANVIYYIPEGVYFSLFLSQTLGLGVAIGWAFWQNYNKLVKIIYIPLGIIASITLYCAVIDISAFSIIEAFVIAFFVWGNLIVPFAFLPNMEWQKYKYIWVIIAFCYSFSGAYVVYITSLAWIPSLMVGLIIFSSVWIKPLLAPLEFSYRRYIFSIIVIAANISLGWLIIVLLKLGFIIGIVTPLLVGNLLLVVLALNNIIERKYWKPIYLFIPFTTTIFSIFLFYTYNIIDIYLNAVIPILIGLVLTFPLMVEYNPFRLLTNNVKILIISIAGTMAVFTFLVLGYVPFIKGQSLIKGLIATFVVILIIYSILPQAYEFTEYTYLYLSAGLAAVLSIIILLLIGETELWKKLILIFTISVGAACLGSYKIVEKKAEQNPRLSVWRFMLLIGGFIAIVVLTILIFAFLVLI